MKKWISRIPFQLVLPCLVLGAVFTLPHAVTWSKYAWQDTIAAFYSEVYPEEGAGFRYYKYTDLRDMEDFIAYIDQVKAAALYDTGITAEYGDQLLTLSTCSYHTEDGRFVVVAKEKSSRL